MKDLINSTNKLLGYKKQNWVCYNLNILKQN